MQSLVNVFNFDPNLISMEYLRKFPKIIVVCRQAQFWQNIFSLESLRFSSVVLLINDNKANFALTFSEHAETSVST